MARKTQLPWRGDLRSQDSANLRSANRQLDYGVLADGVGHGCRLLLVRQPLEPCCCSDPGGSAGKGPPSEKAFPLRSILLSQAKPLRDNSGDGLERRSGFHILHTSIWPGPIHDVVYRATPWIEGRFRRPATIVGSLPGAGVRAPGLPAASGYTVRLA